MFVSLKSRFFLLFLIFMTLTTMFLSCNAEARRLGGGHSMGRHYKVPHKKDYSNFNNNAYKNESKKSINNSTKGNLFSRIIGPVIAGFGLATILSYFGFSGFFVNIVSSLIISCLVLSFLYFIFHYFFARKRCFAYAKEKRSFYESNENYLHETIEVNNSYGVSLIRDFNAVEFSEQANKCFVYMQELWKNGDDNSLKIYLTDEMVRAIAVDTKYNSRAVQVLSLDSEFLNIEYDEISNCAIANIRFFGFTKEDNDLSTTRFDEIWIFQKSYNCGWLLAGIQKNLND